MRVFILLRRRTPNTSEAEDDAKSSTDVDCIDGYIYSNGFQSAQICDGGPSANVADGSKHISGKVTQAGTNYIVVAGKAIDISQATNESGSDAGSNDGLDQED